MTAPDAIKQGGTPGGLWEPHQPALALGREEMDLTLHLASSWLGTEGQGQGLAHLPSRLRARGAEGTSLGYPSGPSTPWSEEEVARAELSLHSIWPSHAGLHSSLLPPQLRVQGPCRRGGVGVCPRGR